MDNDIYNLPNVTEPQPTSSFMSFPPVPVTATLIVSLVWFAYWCIQDYRLFKSLGRGGPPHNVYGWILTSFIVRPFTLAARDTTWTGDYPDSGAHKEILALPNREGERPIVKGIAPQRQFSQRPTAEMNAVSLNQSLGSIAFSTKWPMSRLQNSLLMSVSVYCLCLHRSS